tara:strand:- start:1463 stop:2002 length:540 start_codon:yes stop_codon:yes gene_type:complete
MEKTKYDKLKIKKLIDKTYPLPYVKHLIDTSYPIPSFIEDYVDEASGVQNLVSLLLQEDGYHLHTGSDVLIFRIVNDIHLESNLCDYRVIGNRFRSTDELEEAMANKLWKKEGKFLEYFSDNLEEAISTALAEIGQAENKIEKMTCLEIVQELLNNGILDEQAPIYNEALDAVRRESRY